ncbi:unnamed protein product [Auanema sp. JU1783]|nr:unnamed protein product [Auanema sp. JU1783]
MTDSTVNSLHTVFVIIYLQEFAWIFAPLLISSNVFLHAYLRKVPERWLFLSFLIFIFFLISGIILTITLYLAHSRALCQRRPTFFLPYIIAKIVRIIVLGAVSLIILLTPELITSYFYASIYGLFESAAAAIALEASSSYPFLS